MRKGNTVDRQLSVQLPVAQRTVTLLRLMLPYIACRHDHTMLVDNTLDRASLTFSSASLSGSLRASTSRHIACAHMHFCVCHDRHN